jgi:superfamily II DNA helicase RecQ
VALTATATSEALQDIVSALGLTDYVFLTQSFNRPNLRYKVVPKKKDIETGIVQFIKEKYPNETGIIYCNARAKTEEVAERLRLQGLMTRHFHAGMNDQDKKFIRQEWQDEGCKIIVATIAFGMGIDKANGKCSRLRMPVYSLTVSQCALSYITIYRIALMRMSSSQDVN